MHLAGRLIESVAGTRAFRALLIAPGRSKNGVFYAPEMLREAVEAGLFEGRPVHVFAKVDADGRPLKHTHVRGEAVGRTTLNVVGVIRGTRYVEGQGVVGDVTFLAGDSDADAVVEKLSRLEEAKGLDAVGLSIDAGGDVDPRSGWGRLRSVTSVDVVTDPAAGGRVLHRLAADTGSLEFTTVKKVLEFARSKHPRLVEGLADGATEFGVARHVATRAKADPAVAAHLAIAIGADQATSKRLTESAKDVDMLEMVEHGHAFVARMREAYEASVASDGGSKQPGNDGGPVAEAQRLLEQTRRENDVLRTEMRLTEALAGANLPDAAAKRVRAQFAGQVADEAKIARVIADERAYVDGLVGAAARGGSVRVTEDKADKLTAELAYMFGGGLIRLAEGERHQPYHGSFNEFLRRRFGFDIRDVVAFGGAANKRIAEDLDATNFTKVFADAANRVVLAAYVSDPQRQDWRKIVKFVPVNDFRTQHRITIGYYGTLPTVNKGASYLQLTTPTDREETYALAKKGGLESVAMEDMLNDDLGAWQELFRRIGIAANDTAYEAVFAQIRDATQATLSDTYTLTSASRSPANEGTAVLSADATGKTNFIAAIRGMAAATGGSGQKKGLTPRFLIIPLAKAEAASYVLQALAGGNTGTEIGNVLTVLKAAVPELVIDYGTTNDTDWYLLADPMRAPVLEFASLGGRTEPEIVVADGQLFGSMFLKDKLDLKVRYIFQVAPVDYAGIYGNDAAS